jgi:hypothetical protein
MGISGCSGVVAVVAGKILVVRQVLLAVFVGQILFGVLLSVFVGQILFGVLLSVFVGQILLAVLFAVFVRQILLAVLLAVGIGCGLIIATSECTCTGSAEVMAEH